MRSAAALLLAVTLGACTRGADTLQGYGEADYLFLSSQEAGVVSALSVREGDVVAAGAQLFSLDPDRLALNARSAAAESAAAASRTAHGGALAQAVVQAEAQADLAARNYARSQELFARGFAPRAKLDSDRAAADAATAALAQARAERDAARRELGSAQAQTGLAERRLADLAVNAPQAGRIERIYRRPGEVVAAGDPILSLLPPANMKVRFFAPEPMLSALQVGQRIGLSCDGCRAGLTARITYIASDPQFTPPVIYSDDERDKLVFLIEARPDQQGIIRPGLPVDVRLNP